MLKDREFFAFYDRPDLLSLKGSAFFEPKVIEEMREEFLQSSKNNLKSKITETVFKKPDEP